MKPTSVNTKPLAVGDNRYHVSWEIDIWADTPREAAEKALALHRKPDNIATVFAITDDAGYEVTVDLLEGEYHPALTLPKLGELA